MNALAITRRATAIALHPGKGDATWIAADDGAVFRFDAGSSQFLKIFDQATVRRLSVSREGSLLFAADPSGEVSIRHTEDGSVFEQFRCPNAVKKGAILGPHEYMTVDVQRSGFLWTLDEDGALASTPICSDGSTPIPFDGFGISADGMRMTLLSALKWMIWDRKSNSVIATHRPIDGMQLMYLDGIVGLSHSGAFYFIYWDDYMVFETGSGHELRSYPIRNHAICGALSDDGRLLAVGGDVGDLLVLDPNGKTVVDLRPAPKDEAIVQVDIGADGALVGWVDRAGGFGLVDTSTGQEALDRSRAMELLGSEIG